MLSMGLWRWYINITVTILGIIHRPFLKCEASYTGFRFRFQVEPTQLGPIDRPGHYLRILAPERDITNQTQSKLSAHTHEATSSLHA
jgi:hypothetical protein